MARTPQHAYRVPPELVEQAREALSRQMSRSLSSSAAVRVALALVIGADLEQQLLRPGRPRKDRDRVSA